MFDPHDYDGITFESEECDRREAEQEEYDARIDAHEAGLCSLRAARDGGAEYDRDLAETASELAEARCVIPEPFAAALSGRRDAAPRDERRAHKMPTLRAGDFRPGESVELALKFTNGKTVEGASGTQAMFTTSLGRLYLDPVPASDIETQVRDLAIAPGEKIRVMRMRKPHGGYGWEVRRIEATLEEQLVKSLEARDQNHQAAGAESPETASPVTETKAAGAEAAEVKATEVKAAATNGTSARVTNHSTAALFTANQGDSQQPSGNNPGPVIAPGSLKLLACFRQAIDAVAEAQVYCRRKGLGITFTSEDVRATAITCYINCTREGR